MVAQSRTPVPVETADGSLTLRAPDHGETYHSYHGARQESLHVFIGAAGLPEKLRADDLSILEVGFGTGLNLGLALDLLATGSGRLHYVGFEPDPPGSDLRRRILDAAGVAPRSIARIDQLVQHGHHSDPACTLTLHREAFPAPVTARFDVIWHDAFSPPTAPELWTADVLSFEYKSLRPGGIWVSYCARGAVRRTLQACGFLVERLPGPPGKREMLRATRPEVR